VKLRNAPFFVPNWVSSGFDPSFLFPERLHCCYCTYIFTAPACTTTIINYLEPCALNAEFHHFIPKFLIKFPYFADLTQTGGEGVKRRPKTGWRHDDWKENSTGSYHLFICNSWVFSSVFDRCIWVSFWNVSYGHDMYIWVIFWNLLHGHPWTISETISETISIEWMFLDNFRDNSYHMVVPE
jgi:hypothetical protein